MYTQRRNPNGIVVYDPESVISLAQGGLLLTAQPGISLPPIEAILLAGSPIVNDWLQSLGIETPWKWEDMLPYGDVMTAYEQALSENIPVQARLVYAILGGWPVVWPDGDWFELIDSNLMILTLAESEPWIEVFRRGADYQVIQRVS